jgi:putative ABC transport system substrate-binding protein
MEPADRTPRAQSLLKRRRFLELIAGGFLATPFAAAAQQAEKVYRVGVLWPVGSPPRPPRMEAFRQGLRESGYVEGQNLTLELRYAERGERFLALVAELIQLDVSVIATFGDYAPGVVQKRTATIPIVVLTDDIVEAGLVTSLARPGGNTTGVTLVSAELNAKRLELLKQISSKFSRVATLWDPTTSTQHFKPMQVAARSLAIQLQILEVRRSNDLDSAFQAAKKGRAEALNVMSSPLLASLSRTIADLAAKYKIPTIYQWREAAEAGGLFSYGPSLPETWRQTALLVGKILKGAKPADLPVEQPRKFELVINLKTAKALGLTIPQSLLVRADEVIR